MDNNQLQLVTFDQAKKLKEAGFDWPTLHTYCADGTRAVGFYASNYNAENVFCSAPYCCLALKWMRDVKGVQCCVNGVIPGCQAVDYEGEYKFNFETRGQVRSTRQYRTYEQAESALLDELLKLIEK